MRSEYKLAQRISNRRAPGEVRDAIVASLQSKPQGATVQEIQKVVEKKLGGPVAPSSIRSLLRLRTDSSQPLFARTGRGKYKLVRR